jgi:hypothetical protein
MSRSSDLPRSASRLRSAATPTDPGDGLAGGVHATRAMTSPEPPAQMVDFRQAAYGALADSTRTGPRCPGTLTPSANKG